MLARWRSFFNCLNLIRVWGNTFIAKYKSKEVRLYPHLVWLSVRLTSANLWNTGGIIICLCFTENNDIITDIQCTWKVTNLKSQRRTMMYISVSTCVWSTRPSSRNITQFWQLHDNQIQIVNGATVFLKIRSSRRLPHLTLAPECHYITTSSTQKDLWQYVRLNFGTNPTSEIFRKPYMESVHQPFQPLF